MINPNTIRIAPEAWNASEGVLNVVRNVAHRMGDLLGDWAAKPPEVMSQDLISPLNSAMQNTRFAVERKHVNMLRVACVKAVQIRTFIDLVPATEGSSHPFEIHINMIDEPGDNKLTPFFEWRVVIDERSAAILCEFKNSEGTYLLEPRGVPA